MVNCLRDVDKISRSNCDSNSLATSVACTKVRCLCQWNQHQPQTDSIIPYQNSIIIGKKNEIYDHFIENQVHLLQLISLFYAQDNLIGCKSILLNITYITTIQTAEHKLWICMRIVTKENKTYFATVISIIIRGILLTV